MKLFNRGMYERIWRTHTVFINRYAWWIVLAYFVATCFALYYTTENLGVNSRTAEMFDPNLEFRQLQDRYNEQFPLTQNNFLVVVESNIPERADSAAMVLLEQFENEPRLYTDVFYPGGDPFFKQNQFLFMNLEELENVTERLNRSYVFLSILSQNYSLRGLFLLLDQVLAMGNEKQVESLEGMFGQMERSIRTRLNESREILSWQQVMGGEQGRNRNRQILQVRANLNYDQLIPAKAAIDRAHELAASIESDNIHVGITGELAMSFDEMQSVTRGAILGSILALILVSLTLWIGLRSMKLILSAIFTLVAGLALTMAFSTAAVGNLNLISIAFTILYIGLGVDYAIHFSLKFNERMHSGQSLTDALKETFMDLNPALMLSAFSTMFGFYAFLPTDFSGVSELGLIAGTGMIISFIVTFTLLPALLKLFYSSGNHLPEVPVSAPLSRQISVLQTKHRTYVRYTAIILCIVSLALLTQISFDYNPINLRDPDTESVIEIKKLIQSDRFTPWTIDILSSDTSTVRQYSNNLNELPLVERVQTVFSFIPNNQEEKLTYLKRLQSRINQLTTPVKDSLSYQIEKQKEAVSLLHSRNQTQSAEKASETNLYRLQSALESLQNRLSELNEDQQEELLNGLESDLLQTFPGLVTKLKDAVQAEKVVLSNLPEGLKYRWMNQEGTYRVQAQPLPGLNSNTELRNFASQVREVASEATGSLITIIESGDAVVRSFVQALRYAFIVITLIIFLYIRNLKYTLYILFPLLLSTGMTVAAMVVFGLQFNFANIITLPLILGLGVDNGIHIVHRYRNRTPGNDLLNTTTARAVFFSSLTTLFSFGNLAFSPHQGTASMGIILSIGLFFVLLTTLLVLPAVLPSDNERSES